MEKRTPIAVKKLLIEVPVSSAPFFFELVGEEGEVGDVVLDEAAEVVEPPVILPASVQEMDVGMV